MLTTPKDERSSSCEFNGVFFLISSLPFSGQHFFRIELGLRVIRFVCNVSHSVFQPPISGINMLVAGYLDDHLTTSI